MSILERGRDIILNTRTKIKLGGWMLVQDTLC